MTSTEVQRTLVKSPPELWAELSDPESLARLLGELGVVRITSVEPERAVRWEAAEATGSVQIRPSAWGTKVTLSVTRKASEVQPTSAPQAMSAGPPASAPQPSGSSQPAGPPQPEPAPTETFRRAVEPGPAARELAPVESASPPGEPAPVRDAGLRIKPATAYARKEPPRPEPQLSSSDEGVPAPPASAAPSPEPTRRGLFVRLFGWRRQPVQDEVAEPAASNEHKDDERERSTTQEPRLEPAPRSALEELQARYEHHPVATPPVPTEDVEAPVAPAPEPRTPQTAGLAAELRAAEELGAGEPREENAAAQGAHAPSTTAPSDDSAAPASGEGPSTAGPSDEEMRAILAGVLDRLGSAHHRPFSRA